MQSSSALRAKVNAKRDTRQVKSEKCEREKVESEKSEKCKWNIAKQKPVLRVQIQGCITQNLYT